MELANKDPDLNPEAAAVAAYASTGVIQLRLRVVDTKKRKPQHKENEAIQFDYNINKDNPEEVAQEMVSEKYTYLIKRSHLLYYCISTNILLSIILSLLKARSVHLHIMAKYACDADDHDKQAGYVGMLLLYT